MVRRSRLGARVRDLLNGRMQRGAVGLTGLALGAVLGLGEVLLIGSIALSQPAAGKARHWETDSPYPDVRAGRTVAGTEGNGFVARFSDGREARLYAIARWTPKGIEAWNPAGHRISAGLVSWDRFSRHNPIELHFYVRYRAVSKDPSLNYGLGGGASDPEGPSSLSFHGGTARPADGSGYRTSVSFIEVPKPGSSGKESFSFAGSDGPLEIKRVILTGGQSKITGIAGEESYVKIVEAAPPGMPGHPERPMDLRTLWDIGTDWNPLGIQGFVPTTRKGPAERKASDIKGAVLAFYVPRAHMFDRVQVNMGSTTGKVIPPSAHKDRWIGSSYCSEYYWQTPIENISTVAVLFQKTYATTFKGVHLEPRS